MLAITGITGQVGGQTARTLLGAGQPVRAVLRDAAKAAQWAALGCETALAAMDDAAALRRAFDGARAVFVLLPPVFDPSPGFAEARACIDALTEALAAARPARVVALSTIGAQASALDGGRENLLSQLALLERALEPLPMPVARLRAAWFVENVAWDLETAAATGVLASHLQPLARPVPMVATADVARRAAELLIEDDAAAGCRTVELEGPQRVSPAMLAAGLGRVLGRPVRAQAVPRDAWEAQFRAQGMRHPAMRMRMLDGFNDGWIEFERGAAASEKGQTPFEAVLRELLARRRAPAAAA